MRGAALLLLAGCDKLLSLTPVPPIDAPSPIDAPGPPAVVQEMTATGSGSATVSVTLPAPPASQHVLVLIGGAEGGAMTPTGGGVTWQTAAYSNQSSGLNIWFGVTDGSSPTVEVANFDTSTLDQNWIDLTEWSGLATANTLDGHTGSGNKLPGSGTLDLQVVTTGAPELVVLAIASYNSIASEDASWTPLQSVTTASVKQQAWHKLASGAGMQSVQPTYMGGTDAVLATFRTLQ